MALKRMIGALLCAAALLPAPVRATESLLGAPTAALPRLAAYNAVYDLSLVKTNGPGAPTSARGRMAFELSGSDCEGYVENVHQFTEMRSSEGSPRLSVLRTAIFEAADGRNFHEDQTPLHVLSFELYENGVSGALKLDYGDFALAGEVAELAVVPTSSTCIY